MTENNVHHGTAEQEDPVPEDPVPEEEEAAVETETVANLETSQTSQNLEAIDPETTEETEDKQTACPPAEDTLSPELKWEVGDQCRAVWSEDRRIYPATVVAVDGEHCRVQFNGYGNEEDVDVSALQSVCETPGSLLQDWKPGSQCRAVYSEDGLVYAAEVLWVKGQHCRIRYNNYNNEEEVDVGSLLSPDELHGPSRAAAAIKGSSWRSSLSSSFDRRRQRWEENQGQPGGERRWNDQSSSTMKAGPGNQNKVKEEANERGGNQQRDAATKSSDPPLPQFPPQMSSGGPSSSFPPHPPHPPPLWSFCSREAVDSSDVVSITNMLMLWYMCGFHTGSFLTQQQFKSSKEQVKNPSDSGEQKL